MRRQNKGKFICPFFILLMFAVLPRICQEAWCVSTLQRNQVPLLLCRLLIGKNVTIQVIAKGYYWTFTNWYKQKEIPSENQFYSYCKLLAHHLAPNCRQVWPAGLKLSITALKDQNWFYLFVYASGNLKFYYSFYFLLFSFLHCLHQRLKYTDDSESLKQVFLEDFWRFLA